MSKGINRRDFFKVAAISGATAAVTSCGADPVEELVPMLVPPSDYVPGISIHFATTCQECSSNCGLVVRTREGRAIKVEGNPKHPFSKGSTCPTGQASIQGLYSPARVKGPRTIKEGSQTAIKWEDGLNILAGKIKELPATGKKILYIGTPRTGTMKQLQTDWVEALGGGDVIGFELSPQNSIRKANELIFGKAEIPHYEIKEARLLVNFGADFMESWLQPVQMMRDYTSMHAFKHGEKGKFVHISPHMSLTGTNADDWISCPSGAETIIALAMAKQLLESAVQLTGAERIKLTEYLAGYDIDSVASKTGVPADKIKQLSKEFASGGKSLALAGGNSTANGDATQLQIAVNLLNYIAGNIGTTVQFGADCQSGSTSMSELNAAIKMMLKGEYGVVIIENVNPVFALPDDARFVEALKKVPFIVSFSTEADETSALSSLHLPTSHFFESWGDSRTRRGIYSLQQPVMATVPGYDTRELGDLLIQLAKVAGNDDFDYSNFQELLKESWEDIQSEVGNSQPFKNFWKESLRSGGRFSPFTAESAVFNAKFLPSPPKLKNNQGMTLIAVNSSLHNANGKNGNRTWMLEIPHPITQVAWDSWVEINPDTAVKLGIKHGELVEVSTPRGKVEVAAWLYYGIEKDTLAIPAGLGRSVPFPNYKSSHGKNMWVPVIETVEEAKQLVHNTVGVNVMDLLPFSRDELSGDLNFITSQVQIKSTGRKAYLVTTDGQFRDDIEGLRTESKAGMGDRSQKGRGFVQMTTLAALHGHKGEAHGTHRLKKRLYTTDYKHNTSFYQSRPKDIAATAKMANKENVVYHDKYKWEMAIDLDRCTGCSACMVACYAENNVPVVGKDRMAVGREMSWLRIERYIEHNHETGESEIYFTPEMCGQCENAGCEPVCPVYATYHTPDGINAMIYNRCVGTRYCSNNCIYKQRRYNWRDYEFPSPLHLQLNPGMTVREKGVMEKCNFCYTRIREVRDMAKDEGREVYDGELQTACQQTCPADAITFGNIKDSASEVSKIKKSTKRGYTQLEELAFLPAITYLKKVKHNNHKA